MNDDDIDSLKAASLRKTSVRNRKRPCGGTGRGGRRKAGAEAGEAGTEETPCERRRTSKRMMMTNLIKMKRMMMTKR
ncbi:MAG: hypothetical protein ACLTSO_08420 [Coprococcus sp.]